MEKHSVGQTIAALRKQKGWTQVELAEKLQVSDKAVSKWEKDDSYPSIEFLPVLAELFGVSIDYLMMGKIPEEKIVIASKMELCVKNNDVSTFNELPDNYLKSTDENGKNVLDYILQYNSTTIANCLVKRFPAIAVKGAKIKNIDFAMWNAKAYVYMLMENNMVHELLSIDAFNRVALKNDPEWNIFSEEYSLCVITSEHIAENIKRLYCEALTAKECNKLLCKLATSKKENEIRFLWMVIRDGKPRKLVTKETQKNLLDSGYTNIVRDIYSFSKENNLPTIEINLIESKELIQNGGTQEDADALLVLYDGVICLEKLLEYKNFDFIKRILNTYPITTYEIQCATIESIAVRLWKKDWRYLFEYAVDHEYQTLLKYILARDVDSCGKFINSLFENIGDITYPDKAKSNAKYMQLRKGSSFGGDYKGKLDFIAACKKQILDDCALKIDMERVTDDLDEAYFRNELDKGNFEIVIIKLCVRLEAILRGKYHYDGDFSEMLNHYCSKYGREDDGWGYDVEANFVKYLHKLRKCRNSIVHSEKKGETMSVDELKFCIDYICKMG